MPCPQRPARIATGVSVTQRKKDTQLNVASTTGILKHSDVFLGSCTKGACFPGMSQPIATARRRDTRLRVVLSYAHRDERLREELSKHLSPLRRSALIETWDDRRIRPGADLDAAIDERLAQADVVLLLISPDFINSDYCYRREMRTALRRHRRGTARVIPIILRPVDWIKTPVGRLLAVPRDGKPVTTWQRRDDAFLDVATSVRRTAEEMLAERAKAQHPAAVTSRRGMKALNTPAVPKRTSGNMKLRKHD